jgi:hypothetical protein
MITEEDIALQKFSNYHSAYLLLLLSLVAIPPWLSINYDMILKTLSNPAGLSQVQILIIVLGAIFLIGIYALALALVWNRCIETEAALKSKCGCSTPSPPSKIPPDPS